MAFFTPQWPAPKQVKCLISTRTEGHSNAPYDSLNMGDHVEDDFSCVQKNRAELQAHLPANPFWLKQTHSTIVLPYDASIAEAVVPEADASFAKDKYQPCVVMTADCLPVLFCNEQGTQVAAAHAGWRGLLDGVLENTVKTFAKEDQIMAYMGPAIGPEAFEVGPEVKDEFVSHNSATEVAFKPSENEGKWLADMYAIARIRLNAVGVRNIYGGGECTYSQANKYFSFRRDGVTGRMASVIWIN